MSQDEDGKQKTEIKTVAVKLPAHPKDDEIITVFLPRRDYLILRDIIEDRRSTSRFIARTKSFFLTLSGIVAAWYFLGEKIIDFITKGSS